MEYVKEKKTRCLFLSISMSMTSVRSRSHTVYSLKFNTGETTDGDGGRIMGKEPIGTPLCVVCEYIMVGMDWE